MALTFFQNLSLKNENHRISLALRYSLYSCRIFILLEKHDKCFSCMTQLTSHLWHTALSRFWCNSKNMSDFEKGLIKQGVTEWFDEYENELNCHPSVYAIGGAGSSVGRWPQAALSMCHRHRHRRSLKTSMTVLQLQQGTPNFPLPSHINHYLSTFL